MLSTLVHFVLAYKFVLAFRFYERDEHRLGAPVGRQLAPECERAHNLLFLGFRMVELGLYNVFMTITTPSDTRPPHAGSAAVAFEHMSYVRYTRHTSPTPPHYLATDTVDGGGREPLLRAGRRDGAAWFGAGYHGMTGGAL